LTNSERISRNPYPLLFCDVTVHAQADGHAGNTCHVTATYYCSVTSPLVRQLVVLLRERIVFTQMLPSNALIKYSTIFIYLMIRYGLKKLLQHY
jgi:hypothetical protein